MEDFLNIGAAKIVAERLHAGIPASPSISEGACMGAARRNPRRLRYQIYQAFRLSGENQQQGYQFRGIDDVYNELNSPYQKHGPSRRRASPRCRRRQTSKEVLCSIAVEEGLISSRRKTDVATFVHLRRRRWIAPDKATTKPCHAAYIAAMSGFRIPTEGDGDADAVTHEVAPKKQEPARVSAAEMKRGLEAIEADLLDCATIADVNKCAKIWASIMERDGWTKDYPMLRLSLPPRNQSRVADAGRNPDRPPEYPQNNLQAG